MTTLPNQPRIFKLQELFGSLLMTRFMAVDLRNRILAKNVLAVEIDFSEIEFASRAFCDELLKIKKLLNKKGIKAEFTNIPPMGAQMLQVANLTPTYGVND